MVARLEEDYLEGDPEAASSHADAESAGNISLNDAGAVNNACHPCSQKASNSACVTCRARNSVSRSRPGFSLSVLRKSAKRDLRSPPMCQAMVATELSEVAAA